MPKGDVGDVVMAPQSQIFEAAPNFRTGWLI